MILDSNSGLRGKVIDETTGLRIPFVIWCNTETGEYEALEATPDGSRPVRPNKRYRGQAKLRFVPDEVLTAIAAVTPKAECPPVPPEVLEKARRIPVGSLDLCEEPGCYRRATWKTGDEQQIEPETGADGQKYERGVIIEKHFYCDRHYRLPVSSSVRGVESEIEVAARPQW